MVNRRSASLPKTCLLVVTQVLKLHPARSTIINAQPPLFLADSSRFSRVPAINKGDVPKLRMKKITSSLIQENKAERSNGFHNLDVRIWRRHHRLLSSGVAEDREWCIELFQTLLGSRLTRASAVSGRNFRANRKHPWERPFHRHGLEVCTGCTKSWKTHNMNTNNSRRCVQGTTMKCRLDWMKKISSPQSVNKSHRFCQSYTDNFRYLIYFIIVSADWPIAPKRWTCIEMLNPWIA